LEKITKFELGKKDPFNNDEEYTRLSSQAGDKLLNIFGCLAEFGQLQPKFIAIVSQLVKEKSFATWLIDDFFPSVVVSIESNGECWLLECKSSKIEATIQSLTRTHDLFKNESDQLSDLRRQILIAATNSLKNNKLCQDNISKAKVIAALQAIRSCILVREQMHMYGGERTAIELLQTSFIADLQDCFTGEARQFNLSQP